MSSLLGVNRDVYSRLYGCLVLLEYKREVKEAIEGAVEQGDGDLFKHPKKGKSKKDDFWNEFTPPKRGE